MARTAAELEQLSNRGDQMTINEKDLRRFSGSETMTRFNSLFKNALLSEGALYLAQEGRAFWLMDIIASVQGLEAVKGEYFQVWRLQVNEDRSAVVTCDDGNGNVLYTQAIEYTDFSLDHIKLYAVKDGDNLVIMLPGEY